MSDVDSAVNLFEEGFSCSQAVVGAYCEQFGLDKETAFKISSGFGGGMHLNQTCGAVTGAFMVIGLKYGRSKVEDSMAKRKTYELVAEFAEKFKARHGYLGCTALLGCNISTEEGLKKAKEKNLFKTVCPAFVKSAGEIMEELL